MICNKCKYEYEIGIKKAYKNFYGTRCPKCNYLIPPEEESPFISELKNRKQSLINEIFPTIRKKIIKKGMRRKNDN